MFRVCVWLALGVVVYAVAHQVEKRYKQPMAVNLALACILILIGYQIWQWPGVAVAVVYCLWQYPTILTEERAYKEFKAYTAELRQKAARAAEEIE